VRAVERDLPAAISVFRYGEADDFGRGPRTRSPCALSGTSTRLASLGRTQEARALFETLIARCNQHGLLSEHIEPATGELWGQTSRRPTGMVGLINSAMRLSISWGPGVSRPEAMIRIGVDIGGTKMAIAALDDSGAELFRRRSDAPNGALSRRPAHARRRGAGRRAGGRQGPAAWGSERRAPFWRKPGSSRTPTRAC